MDESYLFSLSLGDSKKEAAESAVQRNCDN